MVILFHIMFYVFNVIELENVFEFLYIFWVIGITPAGHWANKFLLLSASAWTYSRLVDLCWLFPSHLTRLCRTYFFMIVGENLKQSFSWALFNSTNLKWFDWIWKGVVWMNSSTDGNANDNDEQLIANGYFKANPEGWYDSLNYTSSVNLFEIISRLKHKIEMGFLIILITEYHSDWLLVNIGIWIWWWDKTGYAMHIESIRLKRIMKCYWFTGQTSRFRFSLKIWEREMMCGADYSKVEI